MTELDSNNPQEIQEVVLNEPQSGTEAVINNEQMNETQSPATPSTEKMTLDGTEINPEDEYRALENIKIGTKYKTKFSVLNFDLNSSHQKLFENYRASFVLTDSYAKLSSGEDFPVDCSRLANFDITNFENEKIENI